ncbi:MFS transporter [Paenibacillus thermotolerans]|uniref:MFS transporter n=1 Tax=Paenibacillus thermotolerans TaxID=3027807 RepID=UPI0023688FC1|nr:MULTISPECIES: MFS transporter [unclassified Paenibacillus]
MKTAMWLYLFIFVALFDLHAQYPMLTPFAISLGAAPSFIGFIMGTYSLTHLPGNLLAGYSVDRFGSKPFIAGSLIGAGILLIWQGHVHDPWQLLWVRSASGFVLAFLSPACMALLAKLARDHIHQGKLMSGNGLVHTLASVVSPAAGALLVAEIGFTKAFVALGWGLIAVGLLSLIGVKEAERSDIGTGARSLHDAPPVDAGTNGSIPSGTPGVPWRFFGIPLALSCSQGILFFELPLLASSQSSILKSGLLFSIVSVGALITLAMLFLNYVSAHIRAAFSALSLALVFFGMAVHWPIPLPATLLLIGMCKGVLFPAMATLLASLSDPSRYGRVFSLLSISFSIGAFIGPIAAGQARDHISPYFIAFIALMTALALLPTPIGTARTAPIRT